jgi:hypothetical protein
MKDRCFLALVAGKKIARQYKNVIVKIGTHISQDFSTYIKCCIFISDKYLDQIHFDTVVDLIHHSEHKSLNCHYSPETSFYPLLHVKLSIK